MRVVLDTNILVSGLMTPGGPCARILRLVADETVQVCVSRPILFEYEVVLPRAAFGIDPDDVAGTLAVLRLNSEFLAPAPLGVSLPHPSDRPFLEVAKAADAVLVTGNLRHFPAKARAGVTVASPAEFLDLLGNLCPGG